MSASFKRLVATLIATLLIPIAMAQEGHPLKGSWIGVWEGNETHGENVVVILNWDGERISGMINPGTDNIEIDEATLDPDDWSVHIEADAQTDAGRNIRYVIDGTIQELELPSRSIIGTWRSQEGRGAFDIRRQ
ncbi:MAG: hypothetical protein PVG24_15840 [Gammaproteobacteria bacterium]|jgi:hypothetical protein